MQNLSSGNDLLRRAAELGVSIGKVVEMHEAESQQQDIAKVRARMSRVLSVMRESATRGLTEPRQSVGRLIGGEAKHMNDLIEGGRALSGRTVSRAIALALSVSEVNASMGKIVAAPTAGSCGILPGAVLSVGEALGKDDSDLIDALFLAAGIGMVIGKNATLSGAEGGCQAECGAACAMAAAACVQLAGGSPEQCVHAAALALKNELGLVCDPIAGLVEVPCAKRNGMKAAEAIAAADMALAGIKSVIPFDEVVAAMYRIGKLIPVSLKETSLGGLAITPTGTRLAHEIHKNAPHPDI